MPTPIVVELDELQLAWRRLKNDRPDRVFVNHPHLISWVEQDLVGWLQQIQTHLAAGYAPRQCFICLVPKPGSLLRPGAVLHLEDEVVYNVLVGRLYRHIWNEIAGLQGDPDVAYQLARPDDAENWVRSDFLVWKQWRERSVAKLASGPSYVVVTDVTGFYENIDFPKLMSALRSAGAAEPELALLSECLNRWAHPRAKGIPQGYSSSDILAKFYMCQIDVLLRREGYVHLRYVDDIRIFCRTKQEAKRAIMRLAQLAHKFGLNLQSAKTRILTVADARAEFDGVDSIIRDIQDKLIEELREELDLPEGYVPPSRIAQMLGNADVPAPEVLERTFREQFIENGNAQFEKTLFHYLLTRLGKVGSTVAVPYCIDTLRSRPEETEYILRYFAAVGLDDHQINQVVEYITSADAIYDYQLYQTIAWFVESNRFNPKILDFCRRIAFDQNRPFWLRSYCVAYVGKLGEQADFELLEERYTNLATDLEKADCVTALQRQEVVRRNGFYARVRRDGELVRRAIEMIRARQT